MRPHKLPVISVIAMNNTPTSADAPATRSKPSVRCLRTSEKPDATAVVMNARYAIHAVGTCAYMMRTESPCTTSAGVRKNALTTTHAVVAMASIPMTRVVAVPVDISGVTLCQRRKRHGSRGAENHCVHREERRPRPTVRHINGVAAERCFGGSRRTDQQRGEYRQGKQG